MKTIQKVISLDLLIYPSNSCTYICLCKEKKRVLDEIYCFVLFQFLYVYKFYIMFFSILDSGNLPTEAEGNCLRFYLLQKVSTNAMRALLDKKSGTFAVIWNIYQKFCTQKKGKFLEGYYYFIHLSYHLNHLIRLYHFFF